MSNKRHSIASFVALLVVYTHWGTAAAATVTATERIVGGNDMLIYNAPWQVSIQLSAQHTCGGVIYTPHIIITAAHCVAGQPVSKLQVRAGANQHNSGGTVMPVSAYLIHEHYNPQIYDYNIAVLRLQQPLSYSLSIKAINLASVSPQQGANATTTGWGYTQQDGVKGFASNLQSVQLQIIEREVCASAKYGYGWDFVTEQSTCAAASSKDACVGDAGGPLVVQRLLVGIVSWGYGCAQPNYPGVYADVAVLRLWIAWAANAV